MGRTARGRASAAGTRRTPTVGDATLSQARPGWVVPILIAILLIAVGMDLVFYTGFFAGDDLQYVTGAIELADTGRLSSITLGTIRLVMILPLALVARVTDQNLSAMASLFVLFHLLGVLATYWLGRIVHNPETGLLAASFMAVCPLAVSNAPLILPDHAVTSLVLLSFAALMLAGQRISGASSSRRPVYGLCAVGGVLFALGVGAKITAIIMLPVFFALMVLWVRRVPVSVVLKSGFWFAAAAMIVGGLLWWLFYAVSGLHSPLQDAKFASILSPSPGRVTAAALTPLDRLTRIEGFASSDKYLGQFRWLIPAGLVLYPFLTRRSWAVYLTFLWLCIYMTWGTFSLTHYAPPPVNIRYFIVALPFALIAAAFVATNLAHSCWSRLHGTRFARITLAALGATAGIVVLANSAARANRLAGQLHHSPEVAAVRYSLDYVAQRDTRPVVLSRWLSFRMKPVFAGGNYPQVILTDGATSLDDVQSQLAQGGFLYIDCDYERYPNHRNPRAPSPLDQSIRDALAGGGSWLTVDTLGRFGQFRTRLSALRYIFGGSGHDMDLRRGKRAVSVREVTRVEIQAEPLLGERSRPVALSMPGAHTPTWAHNVKSCEVSSAADGALLCEIAGDGNPDVGHYGGVCLNTGPLSAIRFDVTFDNPAEIAAAYLDLTPSPGTRPRLRWECVGASGRLAEGRQTYTFRPERSAGPFSYVGGDASLEECDHAHFFVRLKDPKSHVVFRVNEVVVERPAAAPKQPATSASGQGPGRS